MRFLAHPAWQGAGVVLAAIFACFSFGGWLYQSGEHGWGRLLLGLGMASSGGFVLYLLALGVVRFFPWVKELRITTAAKGASSVPEIDALKRELAKTQRTVETQHVQIAARDDQLAGVEPIIAWAKKLIERERGTSDYLQFDHAGIAITNAAHLDDPEPYFQIVIPFQYNGTGHIVVGENWSGFLSWDGNEFERSPKIASGLDDPLPFEGDGPTSGLIRITQHVSKELRDRMSGFFERRPSEVEFWIRKFSISLRIRAFDGAGLFDGELLPGDYLTAYVRY